ncbi:hypothetical protein FACS18948_3160 [Clostridia bacterium]|nr:hypothetical protein FACS18948_3160 [Clostridia bacterium]
MGKISINDAFRAFYDMLETNPLRPSEILLWNALMSLAQKSGYWGGFAVASSLLESKTGLKRDTLDRARNTLQQAGLIQWRKSGGRGNPTYEIIRFWEYSGTAGDEFDAENFTNNHRANAGLSADNSRVEPDTGLMPKKSPSNREQTANKARTKREQTANEFDAENFTNNRRTTRGDDTPYFPTLPISRAGARVVDNIYNIRDSDVIDNDNNIVVVNNVTPVTPVESTVTTTTNDSDDLFDIPMAERIRRSDELDACLNVARGINLDPHNPVHIEIVENMINEYPAQWVIIALRRAAGAGKDKQNANYTCGILRNFKANGGPDSPTRAGASASPDYDPEHPFAGWEAAAQSREKKVDDHVQTSF